MKRVISIVLLVSMVYSIPQASAQNVVYDAQVMREVVEHYCRNTRPVASCGVYQEDIEFAQQRAAQMIAVIGAQPTGQTATLVEGMLERIARSFYTAQDPRQKLVSAWYYLYFNQLYSNLNTEKIAQLTDILYEYREDRPLFTVTNPVEYTTRPYVLPQPQPVYNYPYTTYPSVSTVSSSPYTTTTTQGSIRSVSPLKSDTTIRGSVISSESRSGAIDLRIHTGAGSAAASRNNGYRVVATTRSTGSQIFAANYRSNGNWELRMRPGRAIGDITLYLLCQQCGSGTTFTQGSTYYGWTIADSRTFSVGYYRNSRYIDDYDYYDRYDDRYYDRYYDQHRDDYEYTRRVHNRSSYDRYRYEDGYFHRHR